MTTLPAPSQLLAGITHRQMIDIMSDAGIFCSVDKFARILQDAQRRAIAAMDQELAIETADKEGV